MFKDGVNKCVVCEGTGTGVDGYYRLEIDIEKPKEPSPESSVKTDEVEVPESLEEVKEEVKKEVVVEKETERETTVVKNTFEEMLAEATHSLGIEDMKSKKEEEDQLEEMKKLEVELSQLKEKEAKLKAQKAEEEKRKAAEMKLAMVEENIINESKNSMDEKVKKMVQDEIKKREEELAAELLESETKASTKASDEEKSTKKTTEKERLVKERERFANIAREVKKMEELKAKEKAVTPSPLKTPRAVHDNDTESVASKQSVARVSQVDNGDEGSVGGVSIQFPPDFDYDDEDAIRQVIAMAKSTRAKSSAASINSGSTPPMSISFVNASSPSPLREKKRTPMIPKHVMPETPKRKPMIPPSSSSVRSYSHQDHVEDFDDGVSHITLGTSFAASSRITGSGNKSKLGNTLSTLPNDIQEEASTGMTSPRNRTGSSSIPRRSRSVSRGDPLHSTPPASSMSSGRRSDAVRKSSELLSRIDQHFSTLPRSRSRSVSRTRRSSSSGRSLSMSRSRGVISNMPPDKNDDDSASCAGSVSSRVSAASQSLNDILSQIESAKSQLTRNNKFSSGGRSVASMPNNNGRENSKIMSKLEHAKMIEKLAAEAVAIDNFDDEEFAL